MAKIKKIGLLTGGGDCPGLNAVIRVITKKALNDLGAEVIGFQDGFLGLLNRRYIKLDYNTASGILTLGGTILGTSNKADPFNVPEMKAGKLVLVDKSADVIELYEELRLDCLMAVGGDGTLSIANKLAEKGLNIIGVPKTIDNDLSATDVTFGFDSAVTTATKAIDMLHSTAISHHRVMIVELMGRYAGWLALISGLAGGGDVILIPEIPYKMEAICKFIDKREEKGRRFSLVIAAEGAKPAGGELSVKMTIKDSPDPIRLGGIGEKLAKDIELMTGRETRATILGHLQRGGSPTAYDRILGTRFGAKAVELADENNFGKMVALKGSSIVSVPIKEAVAKLKLVDENSEYIKIALALGTSFGV